MKILNLYAGIGGNRKLWGDTHEITAVELDPKIAEIYKDFFPGDNVIVADAHEYLLHNFDKFDFIWSSPPCPSHSKIRNEAGVGCGQNKPIYPDMKLYEEIIFLKYFFKGKWIVENVIAYYPALIKPFEMANHWFWCNFFISKISGNGTRKHFCKRKEIEEYKGFNLDKYKGIDKLKTIRNCVEPGTGLHILNESVIDYQKELFR